VPHAICNHARSSKFRSRPLRTATHPGNRIGGSGRTPCPYLQRASGNEKKVQLWSGRRCGGLTGWGIANHVLSIVSYGAASMGGFNLNSDRVQPSGVAVTRYTRAKRASTKKRLFVTCITARAQRIG
jgi:hypothetical protein